jgi:hypothetical protein
MNRREMVNRFRVLFDAAFRSPNWLSKRGHDLYWDLILIEEALAGPFYSIQARGGCGYVYRDREGRFPGVTDPDTFRDWALRLAREFEQGVKGFTPRTGAEQEDLATLRAKATGFLELVDLAHQIETRRVRKKRAADEE